VPQEGSTRALPPPEVTVLTVERQTIPGQYEWVAQAAASKSVQIRAQVSGVIVERPYVEGTDVPKGKVLYLASMEPLPLSQEQSAR
jgi:membrane fusion protein (multidrug efflux system)